MDGPDGTEDGAADLGGWGRGWAQAWSCQRGHCPHLTNAMFLQDGPWGNNDGGVGYIDDDQNAYTEPWKP